MGALHSAVGRSDLQLRLRAVSAGRQEQRVRERAGRRLLPRRPWISPEWRQRQVESVCAPRGSRLGCRGRRAHVASCLVCPLISVRARGLSRNLLRGIALWIPCHPGKSGRWAGGPVARCARRKHLPVRVEPERAVPAIRTVLHAAVRSSNTVEPFMERLVPETAWKAPGGVDELYREQDR